MRQHIVVVGSLNIDLVVRTIRHPQIGETVIGHDFHTYPGGKGANQAVAVARLGCPVKMIGRVGKGPFGEQLLSTIAQDKVDSTYIFRDDDPTGVAFITVDDIGQNTIVVASGANGHLSPEDINSAAEAFEGASVLLIQLEIPLATVERAISLARQNGAKIVLNPAPAQLLESDLLEQVDFLIPNQTELALLAGQESTSASIDVLRSMGVKRLVVTLGEEGVLVVEDNGNQEHISAHRVPVVDTTAAGDAFAGAFAVALKEGLTTRKAAEWGNGAGALAVTRPGAQPSLPARQELLEFLAERQIS